MASKAKKKGQNWKKRTTYKGSLTTRRLSDPWPLQGLWRISASSRLGLRLVQSHHLPGAQRPQSNRKLKKWCAIYRWRLIQVYMYCQCYVWGNTMQSEPVDVLIQPLRLVDAIVYVLSSFFCKLQTKGVKFSDENNQPSYWSSMHSGVSRNSKWGGVRHLGPLPSHPLPSPYCER